MQRDRPNGIFITRAAAIRPVIDGVLDESLLLPEKRAPKIGALSPKARMALAAAARCLPPALPAAPADTVGVSLGTLYGALDVAEQCLQTLERDGFAGVVPSWYATGLPNAATAIVAAVHKLGGPNLTFLGHHGGMDAILHGCRQIAAGRASAMLAGGLDMVSPALHARLAAAGAAQTMQAGIGMLFLSASAPQEPALGRILGWAQRFHRSDASVATASASLVEDAMSRAGIGTAPKLHVVDRAHLERAGDYMAASGPIYLIEQVLCAGEPGLHAVVTHGRGLADTCLLVEKT